MLVTVRDVNEHAPDIRFETTGTGSDVRESVEVEEEGGVDEFVAHISVEDPDSGHAGRVHCTMPSSHFTLVRMYSNDYKVRGLRHSSPYILYILGQLSSASLSDH